MKKWVASRRTELRQEPRPSDAPRVHAPGPDVDRVLIVGDGLAVGWGTTSHSEALPDALARSLTELTARGADIDVIAEPDMTLASAETVLTGGKLWRYDVIVVTLGTTDALDLYPVEDWRDRLESLVEFVAISAMPSTRVVVVTAESVGAQFSGPFADRADRQLAQFAEASAALSAQLPRLTVVRLSAGSSDYDQAAIELGDAIIDELNASRAESNDTARGPAGQGAAEREAERLAALEETGVLDTLVDDRFDRIVTMARQLYGTSGAAFAVVDKDKVWHKSRSEGVPSQVPRDASFCSTTVMGRGLHVVADLAVDPTSIGDASVAQEVGARFYAGYPVESPSGEQIGALCVFDGTPREASSFDDTLLRQLAQLIEAELRVKAI
jgi:hypothetical protein